MQTNTPATATTPSFLKDFRTLVSSNIIVGLAKFPD
jgi:hypothetical protein